MLENIETKADGLYSENNTLDKHEKMLADKNKIFVTKTNKSKEEYDVKKIQQIAVWACEGIHGVSPSSLQLNCFSKLYDGISTKEISEILIMEAATLISIETPNYDKVAGRLINMQLRKEVYGGFAPKHIFDIVKHGVELEIYDASLLEWYSVEEWNEINSFMDHSRDMSLVYVAMEQLRSKYLVQNRVTKEIKETPQVLFVLIAASLFHDYEKTKRLDIVKQFYDNTSLFNISLPTPIMAGVRTPQRQFSSCVLINVEDSLKSIIASTGATTQYIAARAGIGINGGALRPEKSKIRNGDSYSTGLIPYYKLFQSAIKSASQGSIRNGSGTVYFPCWHYDFEQLIVLKNNKGTDDTRVRHVDYGVQFNRVFYQKLIRGEDILLLSPHENPELYSAFFKDVDLFEKLYEEAYKNPNLKFKKLIPASKLFSTFMEERKNTGRIYLQNVDHANTHSSFDEQVAPIQQSNLCCEIDLPTKPLRDLNDGATRTRVKVKNEMVDAYKQHLKTTNGILFQYDPKKLWNEANIEREDINYSYFYDLVEDKNPAEIALCILSAVNLGNCSTPQDLEIPTRLAVRALDALIDYQSYPIIAAEISTKNRRSIGIGVNNFAYFLAKRGLKYSDAAALKLTDEFMEALAFYATDESANIAAEKGPCFRNFETKYANGIVPADTRKRDVDQLVPYVERMPWNALREKLKKTGIRNSTLLAFMPAETSAQISNSTNGIEPPRAYVSVKQSKHGALKQVVPEIKKLKNKYDLLWDQSSPEGYIKIVSVMQKWIDQGISTNISYNPQFYPDEKIPMSEMLKHIMLFYKFGGKQLYYSNCLDMAGEIDVDAALKDKDSVEPEPEDDCEACKL